MLKNIRLHLDKNEEQQTAIELAQSTIIEQLYKKNLTAFQTHIPSLVPYIQQTKSSNISIFCNKNGEQNIVDYGAGRTLYGLEPEQEIAEQVTQSSKHSLYVDIQNDVAMSDADDDNEITDFKLLSAYKQRAKQLPMPVEIETLVVLGIGLGKHIQSLIENHRIKYLVIYEPEVQYFKSSAFSVEWFDILRTAEKKGTGLFIQIEKDSRDIVADITELNEQLPIKGFHLYKHYNHPIFDAVEQAFRSRSWQHICSDGINFNVGESSVEYLPIWTQSIDLDNHHSISKQSKLRFEANLDTFKNYFSDIYKEFEAYKPKVWLPIETESGEINLIKKSSLTSWYGSSPKQECILNFDNFSEQPNKDGLVLGYNGTKLKHYTHYKFVAATEKLLKEVEEEQGALPESVKSLIMFGIGVGYQVEHLFETHKVEKLFLCEPNRDFFYASLYAIDWKAILTQIDKDNSRIYINIGDDGSHLFRDLLSQFYSIGPYVLASTYFYQSYYNANLVKAVAQLREQLQVVISMGEYYDHARYGIAHTTEILERGYPFLVSNPAQKLSYQSKNVPIFLVGNGPSLDQSIEVIKEWREQAIVVSCGTALMPLHKNGIAPDFHAEIEQNRSTFDWICRIGDFDYLKRISLISCNGIHPDTCDLFKDVFVAFKEGESSTASALEILGQKNYSELQFAFPTVSNFALNIFSTIGCNQIYLFGVDLGFADATKHHSKESGYYQNGKELYDYREKNNTSIVVSGNFRKTVFTKHEFKVSKEILEQSLRIHKIDCFNCSDGARIQGTQALQLDLVLLTSSEEQKNKALFDIKQQAFAKTNQECSYQLNFQDKFKHACLKFELNAFCQKADTEFTSVGQVSHFIENQKEMLFASYQKGDSLLFFLLYGTVNYCNAVFSKLMNVSQKEHDKLHTLNTARGHWLQLLEDVREQVESLQYNFDISATFSQSREIAIAKNIQKRKAMIFSLPEHLTPYMESFFEQWFSSEYVVCVTYQHYLTHPEHFQSMDLQFFMLVEQQAVVIFEQFVEAIMLKKHHTQKLEIAVVGDGVTNIDERKYNVTCKVFHPSFLDMLREYERFYYSKQLYWTREHLAYVGMKFCFMSSVPHVVVPKIRIINDVKSKKLIDDYANEILRKLGKFECYIEHYQHLIFLYSRDFVEQFMLDFCGNRGVIYYQTPTSESFIESYLSERNVAAVFDFYKLKLPSKRGSLDKFELADN